MSADPAVARIAALSCWAGPVEVAELAGGITNRNYVVTTGDGARFVARLGEDIPLHGVMRFNELAAARAAHAAGLSPEVVHAEPGVMVSRFVEGRPLAPEDVRDPTMLARIADVLRRCHTHVARHIVGPVLVFWPFQVCRSYLATLAGDGHRFAAGRDGFERLVDALEAAVGPVTPRFCHNDLLAGNLIDAGDRLWLLDWDYAGFDSPLFDLANLSANNDLDPAQEAAVIGAYYGGEAPPARAFHAMKCISMMRETLWSAVSESRSTIDFDYPAYTRLNEERLVAAVAALEAARDESE